MTFASKGSTPETDNDDCLPWFPPLIDDAGNILPSAEKEDRQRQTLEKKRRNEVVGQTIQRPKKLKPMTAKQLSDLSESAYQDGYASGFKQGEEDGTQKGHQAGLKQGLDESRAQAEKQRKQLLQLIDGLLTPFDQQTVQLEKMLLETIVTLTKSMTQKELSSSSSQVEHLVREALLALPSGSENIAIHVHPNDLLLLKDFYVERMSDWQLVSDPRITQGGCKVETKQSIVDFSVEARLQDLCKQFLDGKLIDASGQSDTFDSEEMFGSENISDSKEAIDQENASLVSNAENEVLETSTDNVTTSLDDDLQIAETEALENIGVQENPASETKSPAENSNIIEPQEERPRPEILSSDPSAENKSSSEDVKPEQHGEGADE